ncbi:YhgE/Pip domain-containing protein [Auraticoccus monumenti]|uniref:Putative membrane protein n=1 Tax=Auraticoccus monumenti TaxID=675864 RepID=A0A1G6T0E7_9ACTN|nr:YhgE/Pip domain-containing protein [Auraticoccus monumenti]SDD22660.1 putative membrane protein [Auraticoccus monumenti]
MLRLERANASRRVTWLSLLGLVLVPVIVAAGFLWAIWGSEDRLDRVQAAVVNLDEGVEIDGQQVPLGRQLVGGLVDSDVENFTWNLSDAEDAADGLASGRYAAVITIPENFSEAATSFGGEADEAEQATIDIRTSQVTGIADGALGQTIGQVAVQTLNSELTRTYLDNIYVGFNDIGEQFSTVADGAGDLADGAEGLSEGVTEVGDGIDGLAEGLGQLGTAGGELATGVATLASGAGQLAEGGPALASGASQLADGVSTLDENVPAVTGGAAELAEGAGEYADGIEQYTGGVDQAAAGVSELNEQLQAGLGGAELSGPSEEDLGQLTGGVDALATGAGGLASGLEDLRDGLQAPADPTDVPECPFVTPLECQAYYAGFGDGAEEVTTAVTGALGDAGTEQSLIGGATALETGAEQFGVGIGELADQLGGLSGLGDQVQQLLDGVDQLDSGLSQLSENSEQLNTGADGLASGASQLSTGLGELGEGIGQLDDGASQLSSGVGQYTAGVTAISDGLAQLSPGLTQYTQGVAQSAEGTQALADGYGELEDGASQLADGSRELADGLAEGATKIPSYDESDRENLSTVVAEPVTADGAAELLPQAGSTSLLMVLALWIGALATFLVVQAVSAGTWMSSRPSWQLALLSMAPGAAVATVQAVALTVVGQVVLDLAPVRVMQLLALLLLIGFAFVGINHALAAWLGGLGRIISVAAVVLTAAGSIISAVPALFDAIRPFLPLSPALDAVRALLTDGTGLGDQVFAVVAWLLVAICASVLAVIRERSVKPATLLRAQTA